MSITNRPYIFPAATVISVLLLLTFSYKTFNLSIDTFVIALATIAAAITALVVFYTQRSNSKRDAARVVLQEIRRAEDILSAYNPSVGFTFGKNIISNNS